MRNCLSAGQLAQLLRPTEAAAWVDAAVLHLSECELCQQRIEELSGAAELPPDSPNTQGAGNTAMLDAVKLNLRESFVLSPEPSSTGLSSFRSTSATPTPGLLGKLEPATRADSLGRFAEYEVFRLLGSGGIGIVYEVIGSTPFDSAWPRAQPARGSPHGQGAN